MPTIPKNVFTYGSLMFAPVWRRVVTGTYANRPATLHGYQRLAVKDEEYPAAIPNPTNNITGLLYLDVSPQDLARLDDFEGEYYERFSITVVISESEHITAEVYILNPRYRNTVEMFEWDVVRFKEVGIGRFISRYQGFDQL